MLGNHRQMSVSAPLIWTVDRAGPGYAGESWDSIIEAEGTLRWVSETTSLSLWHRPCMYCWACCLYLVPMCQEHEPKHSSCKLLSLQWIKKEKCSSVQKHHSQLWIMDNRILCSSTFQIAQFCFYSLYLFSSTYSIILTTETGTDMSS